MKYKILLFDLDDTLLDFAANEADSLDKLFHSNGIALNKDILQLYHNINKQLWTDYENGRIPLTEVLNTRFSRTLNELGVTVDGSAWESQYRQHLGNGHQLIEGALEVCKILSKDHRLFVVTNGVTVTQMKRLQLAGLHDLFENIFTSESIGYQKPFEGFFDFVFEHIPTFNYKDTLIIGDSLSTDIKGGILAGIDTCWFNQKGQPEKEDIKATYTISDLKELYTI
ncbi:noncanonical pyrimidine nucleotidase, YjjG family protein [Anaerocolumna cellulosilytica]|uniref:Noncanonical pyrimidine nucleotidase, YjjG family protein n=1 Tax=Anaerocolumna cellulosilytica TaxID=433286 RepID=A0A6S6QY90_9FIRM|nr:YjjG family noncanonical pyrimidine nucleotidase [Anaerocolumna cellulosilytica]MBB5197232.1 2-haloacid dehalogenase [Anaerocolumna cellulosilytica]BCJ94039.1 noncanonical pyrimidine nucleotidase, YjjG family protein [Anaerocolumna cellulosilytica]